MRLSGILFSAALVVAGLALGCGPTDAGSDGTATDSQLDGTDPAATDQPQGTDLDPGTTDSGTDPEPDPVTDATDASEPATTDPPDPPAPACQAGEVSCDGNAVLACMNNGSGWYEVESCADGLSCNPDTASCQAGCVPHCAGKQCGDDGCGGTCGDCPGGAICTKYGQCGGPDFCPTGGTGTQVGDQMKDLVWNSTEGDQEQLHGYCGFKKAVFMAEVAGW